MHFYLPRSLTITVGLPASGKTTWALSSGFDSAISLDDCRLELWGDYAIQNGPGGITALLQLQEQKIRAAIYENKCIVIHNTHHLREFRKPIIDLAKDFDFYTRIVYFNIDPKEAHNRNKFRENPVPTTVIDEFIATLEIPTENEADELIILDI